jgi:ubiquinone biosynthesis protein
MLTTDVGLDATLASAVPEAYAAYRQPMAAALGFFLEHLSPARAAAVVADQLALPAGSGHADRLFALARRCPTLHKIGQVVARDRRLDPDLRRTLQRLESLPSDQSVAGLRPGIERELGDLDRAGITLDPEPLAEASVAVVVGFTWQGGRGVFKLLRPGVEHELAEELAILDGLGAFLDDRCEALGLPPLDYRDTFAQVRQLLAHEVRLDAERSHLAEAARVLSGTRGVHVPRLLPFHSPRLLSMERIDGRKVTEAGSLAPGDRGRLARTIVEALIAVPVWSPERRALFHADPHAGNLMVDADGRLVPIDWSLAEHLDVNARSALAQLAVGALTRDTIAMLDALGTLCVRPPDIAALRCVIERQLRALPPLRPPGLDWLTGLLDEAVATAGLRVGANLLAFRKALLTLEGVLADVAPGFRLDHALLGSFLARAVAEWPWRAYLPPDSRALPTRISNTDLTRLAASLPWLATLALLDRGLRAGV